MRKEDWALVSEIWQRTDPATGCFLSPGFAAQPSALWAALGRPFLLTQAWCLGQGCCEGSHAVCQASGAMRCDPLCHFLLGFGRAGAVPLLHPLCSHCLLKGKSSLGSCCRLSSSRGSQHSQKPGFAFILYGSSNRLSYGSRNRALHKVQ